MGSADTRASGAGSATHSIYDWQTLPEFLAFALLPDADVLAARPDDEVETMLGRLGPRTATFLFHLNGTLTARFPRDRNALVRALESRGVTVLNGAVTDISKRSIQERCRRLGLATTLAAADGDADETVIVKTNYNYGGEIERLLSPADRQALGIEAPPEAITRAAAYPVLRRADVPAPWWTDRSLVIERFVANTGHRWYRAFFLLTHVVLSEMVNPEPVKKVGGSRMTRQWLLESTGDGGVSGIGAGCPGALVHDLERLRADARLDFGAVDLVVDDDGTPHIIDINSTPAYYFPVPGLIEHLRRAVPERRP
jgi:hypothetical protein